MLNKKYRLTKNGSFNYLYKKGHVVKSVALHMFFIDSKSTKVGFSISTKVGNAVVRNLIKRRLRAIVHTLLPSFKTNFQIVFVAKPQIASFDFLQTDRQVHTLLSKSGIL